ncbi:MAG: hypothetical protein NTY09_08460 [bacterium]|nr:hypothetical protein [bacterium]
MGLLAGLYPFFLLGLRRTTEKAGLLSLATFFVSVIALSIPLILCGLPPVWKSSGLSMLAELPDYFSSPYTIIYSFITWFYVACFMIPFVTATASDMYFRNDWRANSIILVSPLSSRDMFFGKFAILFTIGLTPFALLLIPLVVVIVGTLGGYIGFIQNVLMGFFIYSVSVFFLAGFTRRWEALLFWMFVYPIGGIFNGIFYFLIWVINRLVIWMHTAYASTWFSAFLPTSITFPQVPTWVMSFVAVVITAVLIVRKGTTEIQKMRTGLIPLGRLTEKTLREYRKEKEPWYTPEFVRADRVPKTSIEIYIPVGSKDYKPSSTDKLFNFIIAIIFFGKRTMLFFIDCLPEFIKESPIYTRHTARFRGFLEGYYEPSSTLKSRIVAGFILFVIFGMFNPILAAITLLLMGIKGGILYALLVTGFVISIVSPFDAYIRLARYHRESMAWESVIITPIEGRSLISGTFGVLLTHRMIPMLPFSIYVVIISLFYPEDFFLNIYYVILIHILHFTGLSLASGISWLIARRGITGSLLSVWIFTAGYFSWYFLKQGFQVAAQISNPNVIALYISIPALVLIGMLFQVWSWRLFDRYARHPLDRGVEEGG